MHRLPLAWCLHTSATTALAPAPIQARGLQPVAPLDTLIVDPVLPTWMPEVVLRGLRLGNSKATLRFWRDPAGASHVEALHKQGTFHVVKQPVPESLTAGVGDRFTALVDGPQLNREHKELKMKVTLVKPASVDTPFFQKARTYVGVEPQPVPPVYAPEVVADVILHAAEHPLRELIAGGSGAKLTAARFFPRLADLYMERWTFASQMTARAAHGRPDNLYEPVGDDGGERGRNWRGHTRESSAYTSAFLHPGAALIAIGAAVCVAAAAAIAMRRSSPTSAMRASA